MEAMPGARELVLSLLEFDPAKRPTMYAALSSLVFVGLRERGGDGHTHTESDRMEEEEGEEGGEDKENVPPPSCGGKGPRFMAYYRGAGGEGNVRAHLPLRMDI
jgi:hypothetical protein